MNKPHKHATLIKAWADGAVIQYKDPHMSEWEDVLDNVPGWCMLTTYRIKPKTIKYRNFLWKTYLTPAVVVSVVTSDENYHENRETWAGFIKWLGDWQEVVVD